MTATPTTVDYDKPYDGSPAVGQFVEFEQNGETMCGLVVDIIVNSHGISLAVRVSPGRTIDMFWQRVRACEMPSDWHQRFEPK
jgi:hypothetical protein